MASMRVGRTSAVVPELVDIEGGFVAVRETSRHGAQVGAGPGPAPASRADLPVGQISLCEFGPLARVRTALKGRKSPGPKWKLSKDFKVDRAIQWFRYNFLFRFTEISAYHNSVSRPVGGALRDRHECWVRDAMDANVLSDVQCVSGRRSRVVLTPLGWRQVCR
jgi:hypothetical protein